MAAIGAPVSFYEYNFPMYMFTVNLASGITVADKGKAVSWDGTNANQMKLAADGDTVVGRLETVEDREQEGILVGTVAFHFSSKLPMASGASIAVGDTVVGAGSGEVKEATANDPSINIVTEIDGTDAVVLKV